MIVSLNRSMTIKCNKLIGIWFLYHWNIMIKLCYVHVDATISSVTVLENVSREEGTVQVAWNVKTSAESSKFTMEYWTWIVFLNCCFIRTVEQFVKTVLNVSLFTLSSRMLAGFICIIMNNYFSTNIIFLGF